MRTGRNLLATQAVLGTMEAWADLVDVATLGAKTDTPISAELVAETCKERKMRSTMLFAAVAAVAMETLAYASAKSPLMTEWGE